MVPVLNLVWIPLNTGRTNYVCDEDECFLGKTISNWPESRTCNIAGDVERVALELLRWTGDADSCTFEDWELLNPVLLESELQEPMRLLWVGTCDSEAEVDNWTTIGLNCVLVLEHDWEEVEVLTKPK